MELTNIGTKENMEIEQDQWLEEIMDEYGDRLTILAFSYLKDWGKAQEVVQDVFVTCYKMYKTSPEIISFKSWIYRVTVNLFVIKKPKLNLCACSINKYNRN
jgi:DNA-directed RNA polymerase specialized sigma24 family protein